MRGDATAPAMVFSHPNHELGVYGLLQRWKPYIAYLTDGGGDARVAQTQRGLDAIGLLDHAAFLNHPEHAFYAALLARDVGFFAAVAGQVAELFAAWAPTRILCDAVEFYNPLHDLSLPIVRAAFAHRPALPIFEIPLIYQASGPGERYAVQRLPTARRDGQTEVHLTAAEVGAKLRARDEIYTILRETLGDLLLGLTGAEVAVEVVGPAAAGVPAPDSERVLRYEWRGRLLEERAAVPAVITYAGHYRPVAAALMRPLQ